MNRGRIRPARSKSNSSRVATRYFTTDGKTVKELDAESVVSAWYRRGQLSIADSELSLLTVVHDNKREIASCYFMQLRLQDGKFTLGSQRDAALAQIAEVCHHWGSGSEQDARRQIEGWPRDWKLQVGEILGMDGFVLNVFGVGGPLAIAFWNGINVDDVSKVIFQTHERRGRGRE